MNNFCAQKVLDGLKPFQRASVEHAFKRLYESEDSSKRFLVADEVGLGKTIVAKGVIAKVVEKGLKDKERVDIIYICSNADIAHQNVSRLNVTSEEAFIKATRLSLLATVAENLNENKLNLISFTPGTTFSKGYRTGSKEERRLLYKILVECYKDDLDKTKLSNFLQGNVKHERWKDYIKEELEYDATIAEAFACRIGGEFLQGGQSLKGKLDDLMSKIDEQETPENKNQRLELISKLRSLLADCSLSVLKPSLIIMDEFQRFSELFADKETAKKLFEYQDVENNNSKPRILLLSATPYKMYANRDDEAGNYQEFLKTLQFLANVENDKCEPICSIKQDFERIKNLMQLYTSENKTQLEDLEKVHNRLQENLFKLMCRTERVSLTEDQNSMLEEELITAELTQADLLQLRAMTEVLGSAPKQLIELWKSSPYIFNFMKKDSYKLKKEFDGKLSDSNKTSNAAFLNIERVQNFSSEVDVGNLKLRKLLGEHLDSGMWKLLWIPPAMPYWQPSGEYKGTEQNNITKELIFSSWDVVPDALTSMISYAVEQKMVTKHGGSLVYQGFAAEHKPKLNFSVDSTGSPESMAMFSALFPVPALAKLLGPAIHRLNNKGIPTLKKLKRLVEEELDRLIKPIEASQEDTKSTFPHYIAALAAASDEKLCLKQVSIGENSDSYEVHKNKFKKQINKPTINWQALEGKDKQNIINMVLGGPGVCALRALKRLHKDDERDELSWHEPQLLNAAIQISEGLRTLFNRPEVTAMLTNTSNEKESYWERVLRYCVGGNLQAVLDEYVHMVSDSIGGPNNLEKIKRVAEEVREALSLRTSRIGVDTYGLGQKNDDNNNQLNIRTHYATRFADSSAAENVEGGNRKQSVISAFNSPFRPFVLVSTSVGQEGLDFHHWCHSVLHWNLPSNPVDLEQREGRVHRWKNHAVRKNVALKNASELKNKPYFSDIWPRLFELAEEDSLGEDKPGLYPNWLYEPEGGVKIKRRIINPPLSGDIDQYRNLQSYLSLYRMAFGQPRQEDFIRYLEQKFGEKAQEFAKKWQIQLSPIKNDER